MCRFLRFGFYVEVLNFVELKEFFQGFSLIVLHRSYSSQYMGCLLKFPI